MSPHAILSFASRSLLLAAFALVVVPARAQPYPSSAAWEKLPPHPRLFADAARFRALRAQDDAVSRQLRRLLLAQADENLTAPAISYVATGSFLLAQMGMAQGRILSLALAFRLTDDERYFQRARAELLALAAVPNWGTNHMLDVGVAAVASGVGLDWLFDRLTADERATIAAAIADKALSPTLSAKEGKNGWVDGNYNWNQVCNGGLSVGALAIAELQPVLARRIVDRAIKNIPAAAAVYEPDGTYAEGTGYWSFGTTYHVIFVEALRSVFGISGGLVRPGFLKSPDFIAQMIAPSGEDYNFSDAHRRNPAEPVIIWFARERRERGVARELFSALEKMPATPPPAGQRGEAPETGLGRQTALALLWWDPSLPPEPAGSRLPLHWIARGDLPLAVFRSAWDDPRATYVAVKGGTPNNSHAHMDVGSFILEADGVRWAIDLGSESYAKMRAAKLDLWNYAQESTRWTTFRVGPEAHNILRFDGRRQLIAGRGEIRALPSANCVPAGAAVDLTPLHSDRVSRVERRVHLQPDRSVIFDDEWTAGPADTHVTWQWLTRAEVTLAADGATLRQNGETLDLRITEGRGARIEVEDVSAPRNPWDSANPGLRRIVIRLDTPALSTARLHVLATPGTAPAR